MANRYFILYIRGVAVGLGAVRQRTKRERSTVVGCVPPYRGLGPCTAIIIVTWVTNQ